MKRYFNYRALFDVMRWRFAKGSRSAVHLIHRGAVPLPLEGKDNAPASEAYLAIVDVLVHPDLIHH